MNLSNIDESRLTLWFAKVINDAQVSRWGTYIDEETDLPELTEDLQKPLDRHLDRGGLIQFAEEEIYFNLLKNDVSPEEDYISLLSVDKNEDAFSLSSKLIERVKSLPINYTILVRGPKSLSDATKRRDIDLKISNQLSLTSSSLIKNQVLFTTECAQLDEYIWRYNDIPIKKLEDNYLYFTYRASGYISDRGAAKLIQTFLTEIRSFYGACLAHNILYPYSRRDGISPVIMGMEHGSSSIINVSSLETDLVQATYFIPGEIQSRYNKIENFYKCMAPVIAFFKCNSPKLKTAAIWLLRAKLSQRPMDRVLESAIALEVLLGDQKMADKIGLTKLMANRCAYALCKSTSERDDLMKFFGEFYKLRSDIVHAGRFSHSNEDSDVVRRGMNLASQMLVFEQNLRHCD